MENLVVREHTACEILYLHVVEYNETALRFYERNKFSTLKRIKNHYVIFEKDYDGYLLYKDIKNRDKRIL
jgi:ribosomal protein S18 acetylase RimI-like enzyme